MKTVTRFLLFLAFAMVWLVIFEILNNTFWHVEDDYVVLTSLVVAIGSTALGAWLLKS